ncbi:MAG TPA: adenylate/guanylate cyclase domain-containing protein [Jatrophihabitans sp.]|nr:adenylate/guanylate cyclase domain-containing protein [Jatrophihabitans sp.]
MPAPDGAKFCSSCGAALAAASVPPAEERRLVTVVFCDLVGSTVLAGHLDPEVLRSVTLRYFDLMRDSVQAHGGTVEKFIGDAVMAVFGIPQLHEDDARRALAAALDMTGALAKYNLELQISLGIELNVRIGVNTGEVIAATDPSANQALVSGDVVNVAARLEQNAEAGQILIGAATVEAAGRAAVTRAIPPLRVKGKDQPVPAFQLLELLADDPEVLRRFDVPFVGRDFELAELDLMLERTQRLRRCHLVNVYGDAGIGKTRLVRTWQTSLNRQVARLGTGRCRPYGDAGTLTALAEATDRLLADTRTATMSVDALDLLRAGLLKDGTPSPSLPETVAALSTVVTALAQEQAVVLVLDDCQWASKVLLDLLDELAEYLDREPVLLVCLARPELVESRPSWGSGRLNVNSMVLQGLSVEESALLAADLVEVSAHAGGSFDQVLERAEGNPLHLEQLFTSLSDVTGTGTGPLPPTVFALLASRIDSLDPAERLLLDLAAIMGREFSTAGLASFAGELDSGSLRGLTRRRLIEPVRNHGGAPSQYRFSSGLIQEVAYKGMAKRVRAERHQRFAEFLRSSQGNPPAQLSVADAAESAGHLERAYQYRAELSLLDGDAEQLRVVAAAQLGAAGVAALGRADLCWAEDLLTRAVALLGPDEHAWAPLAQRLAEVLLALGRRDDGLRMLTDALQAAAGAGDGITVAHARLQLAVHDPAAGYGTAADAARTGLPIFEQADDPLGLARAGVRIAQELQFHGRHGEADAVLVHAVDQAVRADAEPERALALGALGISLWRGPIPADEAIQRCQRLLAEHGPHRSMVQVTLNCPLAVLLALQGRIEEAEQCLQLAGPLACSLGYAEADVFMPLFTATVAALAGHADRAEQLLRAALQASNQLGRSGLDAAASRDLARILLDRGLWDEAHQLTDGLAPADQGDPTQHLAPSEAADQFGIRSRIEALRGNTRLAAVLAEQAGVEAGRTDSPISRGVAALDSARVLALLGDSAAARDAALAARRWFEQKRHLVGVGQATELAQESGPRR